MIVVAEVITHMPLGGAQRLALELAAHLPELGEFETYLLTAPSGDMFSEARSRLGHRLIPVPHFKRELSLTSDLAALVECWRALRKLKRRGAPLVVHTHAPKAGVLGNWAGWLAGASAVVHTLHGLPYNVVRRGIKRKLLKAFARIGQLPADFTVSVCRRNLEQAFAEALAKPSRSAVIPPAVHVRPSKLSKLELRRRLDLPQERFVISMVASLKPPKDTFGFLHTAALVLSKFDQQASRKPFFVLVGGGEQFDALATEAARLGLEQDLLMTGWRDDAQEFIAASDLLVLLSFAEGLPLVLVEAAMLGVPTVATDVGCAAEVASVVVPAGDVNQAAGAILDAIKKCPPVSNRSELDKFLPDQVAAEYAKLFEQLVKQ